MFKLFVQKSSLGMINNKTLSEDYREIYELEIELNDNRVLSRKVRDADISVCMEFINEINKVVSA